RQTVCHDLTLVPEGIERYRVFSPFMFHDGDHLALVLKREESGWVLSDEGHTMMHLSYRIEYKDLTQGKRGEIIDSVLSKYGIRDRDGEFICPIPDEQYGDALFQMVQGLLKVSDISFLSREHVRSTFRDDVLAYINALPGLSGQVTWEWHDPIHDPEGMYPADGYFKELNEPIVLFLLQNDDRVRDATINLLQYEKWGVTVHSVAIFENQELINRKALAKLSDVCDKMFSNFTGNKDRIRQYLVHA
ncbi:MAG: DUF1828 domain-containing protein, partial [Methanomicrobiales archaeon]|nr:DUF1828 domain-containing protein [Methanomicrobiales archaeon]